MKNIRILDLSRLLPGGMCTRILADLGADVVKVEEPGRGDYLRGFPPISGVQSALFNELNRGKRSVVLDLKSSEGRDTLLALIAQADVLVESFRPGVLARLGCDPEQLLAQHPRLIICSISGFGQQHALRNKPAHDVNFMGYAGALPLFVPRGSALPIVPGVQLGDYGGGAFPATIGILAALFERTSTGRGQWIDISISANLLQWLALVAADLQVPGETPAGGMDSLTGGYACYSIYATADGGALTVAPIEPHFWAIFCRMLDREHYIPLQYDPEQQAAMFADLSALFASRSRDEWLSFFGDADVCVGPVLHMAEALQVHRDQLVQIEQPGAGLVQQVAGMFGRTAMRPAPLLGEHTAEVIEEWRSRE